MTDSDGISQDLQNIDDDVKQGLRNMMTSTQDTVTVL